LGILLEISYWKLEISDGKWKKESSIVYYPIILLFRCYTVGEYSGERREKADKGPFFVLT